MAVHGKTGYVTFGGSTLCATEWNISVSQDEVDVTTFCSTGNWKEYILGFKDGSGDFTMLECADLQGSSGAATFGNDEVVYSGSIIVTGHDAKNSVDARFESTWKFRFTGDVSITCS